MRVYSGFMIGIAFLFWILYRLLVKKDLKFHMQDLYVALLFAGVWGIIYYALS